MANVARYVGYRPERYRVVDLSEELIPHAFTRGMGLYEIGKSWHDADIRISFAKMKSHVNTVGALTIRNIVTVVPQFGDHIFTGRLSDLQTVMMALLHDFPPHFGIIDGYENAADGLMGFMADPTPKHPHLFVAGADVICVDYAGLRLMGERDPTRALDIRAAIEWFGDPRPHGYLLGELTPIPNWDRASSGLSVPLAAISLPIYTALSGQGSYFAADMDPEAFPAIDASKALSVVRGRCAPSSGTGSRRDEAGRAAEIFDAARVPPLRTTGGYDLLAHRADHARPRLDCSCGPRPDAAARASRRRGRANGSSARGLCTPCRHRPRRLQATRRRHQATHRRHQATHRRRQATRRLKSTCIQPLTTTLFRLPRCRRCCRTRMDMPSLTATTWGRE